MGGSTTNNYTNVRDCVTQNVMYIAASSIGGGDFETSGWGWCVDAQLTWAGLAMRWFQCFSILHDLWLINQPLPNVPPSEIRVLFSALSRETNGFQKPWWERVRLGGWLVGSWAILHCNGFCNRKLSTGAISPRNKWSHFTLLMYNWFPGPTLSFCKWYFWSHDSQLDPTSSKIQPTLHPKNP